VNSCKSTQLNWLGGFFHTCRSTGLASLVLLVAISPVQAHHRVGHGGRVSRPFSNPFSRATDPPSSRIEYSSQFDQLDHDVGQLYTQTLTLERGFRDKLSLSVAIPMLTLDSNFRSEDPDIGDVSLSAKATVLQSVLSSYTLTLGTDLSLPTGDVEKGFGADDPLSNLFVNYVQTVSNVTLFGSFGTTLTWQKMPRPSFDYSVGASRPVGRERLQLYLSFNGETLTSSAVYQNNGTRLFLVPGFGLGLTQTNNLTLNIGFQQRIHDGLKPKEGTLIFLDSATVVNDRSSSLITNVTWAF